MLTYADVCSDMYLRDAQLTDASAKRTYADVCSELSDASAKLGELCGVC
jgi:hypothetical protein